MSLVIAVIAPGAMGSAVGQRLTEHGARVLTSLEGRSEATIARAQAAGMQAAMDQEIAEADMILSIVPPADALSLAQRLAPVLRQSETKPLYLDCNAVNVETVEQIGAALADSGCHFLDATIIGAPPKPEGRGPAIYVSGAEAQQAAQLQDLGLDIRVMDGPIGAASALKMSYAGITKGLTALASAMLLAATRAGAAPALYKELAESQPQLLARFETALPDMYPKAYRWVAEMREIAGFLAEDKSASLMLEGAARIYERLAADVQGEGSDTKALDAFFGK